MKAANAGALPRYFGFGRGLSVLTSVTNHYATFGTKVIPANAREGLFALDEIFALRDRDSELAIAGHTTDTAGFTDLLFGVYDVVGLGFWPRIRDLADQRLWCLDDTALPDLVEPLMVNIGQCEAATHIAGVSARELSMVRNRHIDLGKLLCAAIAAVVSAFAELDVVQAWGDGTAVAADGMHVEAYIDNLAVGADVGIPGLRPHRCRQTYGTRLRQGGADSAQVQALLGHASLDTAARYFRSGSAENAAVIERTFDR